MEESKIEYVADRELSPEPIVGLDDLAEDMNIEGEEDKADNSASVQNPNKDDDRRLFQVYNSKFMQDPDIEYRDLPNRLQEHGPIPLLFPDHFWEVLGGVVVIYWEKDRSTPCICSIVNVVEEKEDFEFQLFGTQAKKRKTYFDSGKLTTVSESKVWRLVQRKDFEAERKPKDIRCGQVIRVRLQGEVTDSTGFVSKVEGDLVSINYLTGLAEGRHRKFKISSVISVDEILSSPLFYRLKKLVAGESMKGGKNLDWVKEGKSESHGRDRKKKPKMLLRVPEDYEHKRVWHFLKLFPMKELEYCTNVALENTYGEGNYVKFDGIAFFAAQFTARRLGLSVDRGYRNDLPWANQTRQGGAVGKLPRKIYRIWHSHVRGYLPIDREFFQGSLIAARDREYAVCRLKPKFLKNSQDSREPPLFVVCDEQIDPYSGHKSGLKKRKPKKRGVGLEYHALACSNKEYEGFKDEIRAKPVDGEEEGRIVRQRDPVSGGFKLDYKMSGGPRYEFGYSNPSKTFGMMLLLIFGMGNYLRYGDTTIITDSAFGFLEGLLFLSLWGLSWVTSFRLAQRRGFSGITEFTEAYDRQVALKKKEPKGGRSYSKEVAAFEKETKGMSKGTSWSQKCTVELINGVFRSVWLTAVLDSKICYRLDNFLGPAHQKKMRFWDYKADGKSDVKGKSWVSTMVAKSHQLFRKNLGYVDQSDVKAAIMGLTTELTPKWYQKQFAYLCESAVSSAHSNYNLDPAIQKPEFFTDYHDKFLRELIEMSKNYRTYKILTPKRKFEHRPIFQPRSHKKKNTASQETSQKKNVVRISNRCRYTLSRTCIPSCSPKKVSPSSYL